MKRLTFVLAALVMLVAVGQLPGQTVSLVADLYPGYIDGRPYGSRPGALTVFNDELYFRAWDGLHSNHLWKTDGTNTVRVADINTDRETRGGNGKLTVFDGAVYFAADNGNTGWELWKSDGTSTVQLADIRPGSRGSFPFGFTPLKGEVYFGAFDIDSGTE